MSAAATRRRTVGIVALAFALAATFAVASRGAPPARARSASNGVAARSASAIVTAARTAIDGVSSVRVRGSGVFGSEAIGLDLELLAGKGGAGTVTENGASFRLIVIGKVAYFNGSAAYWKRYGGSSAAALFAGRWLKEPTTGPSASLALLTSVNGLFGVLLAPSGVTVKGGVTRVRGEQVVSVTNRSTGGTLYVATSGKPYPVEVVNSSRHATLVIDRIDQRARLAAPSGAIELPTGGSGQAPSAQAQEDATAKELAHSAQVAAETYATDHAGSYAGLTPSVIRSFVATVQTAPGNGNAWLSVARGTRTGYTLTATSTSGHTFSIVRAGGSVTRTCTPRSGVHGGCDKGTW